MKQFNVRINVTTEAYFDTDIEADSHEEAEQIANNLVWNDELTDDLRQHAEIVDERYDATQWFVCECGHGFNENQMTDNEECPACETPIPDDQLEE